MTYPLNKRIIDSAKGIIAHSYFTRNRIKSHRLDVPIRRVNFHALEIAEDPIESYQAARKTLGIADREIIVASFGFVTPTKRIDKLLAAVARLCKEGYRLKYYIVGGELGPDLERRVKELGIPKGVVASTGFLGLNEGFLLYMRATDIGCNLRYPVNGETSSTLHRLLGMGKPVLVSNAGSFREYPDQACVKIDVSSQEEEEIYERLREWLEDEERRSEFGRAAYTFAKENLSVERSARDYYDFIASIAYNRLKYEALIEHLAHGLVASGLDENETLVKELSESIARLP